MSGGGFAHCQPPLVHASRSGVAVESKQRDYVTVRNAIISAIEIANPSCAFQLQLNRVHAIDYYQREHLTNNHFTFT